MKNQEPVQIMKDKDLHKAYWEAVRLGLSCEFIQVLIAELDRRNINTMYEEE